MSLQEWIDSKFAIIATKLPQLAKESPAGFRCGHTMGYKQALLDLDNFLMDNITDENLASD